MTLRLQKNGLFPPDPSPLRFFKNTTSLTRIPGHNKVGADGEI